MRLVYIIEYIWWWWAALAWEVVGRPLHSTLFTESVVLYNSGRLMISWVSLVCACRLCELWIYIWTCELAHTKIESDRGRLARALEFEVLARLRVACELWNIPHLNLWVVSWRKSISKNSPNSLNPSVFSFFFARKTTTQEMSSPAASSLYVLHSWCICVCVLLSWMMTHAQVAGTEDNTFAGSYGLTRYFVDGR